MYTRMMVEDAMTCLNEALMGLDLLTMTELEKLPESIPADDIARHVGWSSARIIEALARLDEILETVDD